MAAAIVGGAQIGGGLLVPHLTRQSYVNGMIPWAHRATILSFDSLMGSGGGVVFQPLLGKTADV